MCIGVGLGVGMAESIESSAASSTAHGPVECRTGRNTCLMLTLEDLLRLHAQDHPVAHIDLDGTAQLPDNAVVYSGSDVRAWPNPMRDKLACAVVVIHSMDVLLPVLYPIVHNDYLVKRATVIVRNGYCGLPRLEIGLLSWLVDSSCNTGEWTVIQLKPMG